jgi:menaquinone-dependent protoporphyrinogen IX oxidase
MIDNSLRGLIVYGTSFGATRSTSEEIAQILREENFDIDLVNAKEEKVKDISKYKLVIVGSSLANCRWNNQAEHFLKKFHKELENKVLALFVSSVAPIAIREGNTMEIDKIRKLALEDKVSKYSLNPVMKGLFGGVLDYNKMGFLQRKGMEVAFKSRLQNTGFTEIKPGVYDLRDWDEIHNWTRELIKKVHLRDLRIEGLKMERKIESGNQTGLNGKTLVVYYSRGGNTRLIAEEISKRIGSDIDVLRSKSKETKTSVDSILDPSKYNLVVIGKPVNGFTVSKPVAEYLKKNEGKFNEIATYATYSLWPANTLKKMAQLSGKTPIASAIFKSRDIKLRQFSEKIASFTSLITSNYSIYEHSPKVIQLEGSLQQD